MPSAAETLRALYGAWRLARFDPDGMTYFDVSERGFWASFFAALIVAPLYALFLYLRYAAGLESAPAGRFVPIKAIAYLLSWIAFPLAMATYTRLVGRWPRYVAFVVAYNWCSVLQNGLFLGILILATLKMLPTPAANFLGVMAFGFVIAYSWVVARIALRTTGTVAAGAIAIDFFLGFAIDVISDRMLR